MLDVLYLLATLETARLQLPLPEQDTIILAQVPGQFGSAHGGPTVIDEDEIICPGDPRCPAVGNPAADAGAQLPITYTAASECSGGCTIRYMDDTGSGSACTTGSPCGTITQANNTATAGDFIVVRSGTYRLGARYDGSSYGSDQFVTKDGLRFWCETGGTCTFEASLPITPTTTDGIYKYATYQDQPCSNGSGTNFCLGQGVTGGNDAVGELPDQLWVDGVQWQQVTSQGAITTGKFWVNAASNRLYMLATDVNAHTLFEACDREGLLTWSGANGSLKGVTLRRYCNTAVRGTPLDISATADGFLLENVVIEDSSLASLVVNGNTSDVLNDVTLNRLTISGSNWMGILAIYGMNTVYYKFRCTGTDRWDEYASSPSSGCIKFSRGGPTLIDSAWIENNKGKGFWWDESTYDATLVNSTIINTGTSYADSCVFFEISDLFHAINNYISCPVKNALMTAGSSGLHIIGNTLIGGPDTLSVYAEARSEVNCPTTGISVRTGLTCLSWIVSNVWNATNPPRPATITFIPQIQLIMNNIVGYPTAVGYCGGLTALCIQDTYAGSAPTIAFSTIIHTAGSRPQTVMDCNVYAISSGSPIRIGSPSSLSASIAYATTAAFEDAFDESTNGFPGINGLEANSLVVGPTNVAQATGILTGVAHTAACATPTDAAINDWLVAGTKHFGVNWQ